jgi:hypothetical protein
MTAAALVLANVVPVVGVAFFGWDVRQILLLYWAENIVVAIYTALRMLRVGGLASLPLIVFFAFHFGLFTFVHGIFVNGMTQTDGMGDGFNLGQAFDDIPTLALLGLFISHGVSFAFNFLFGGESKNTTLQGEMMRPYPRMIVLHVAIIAAGFFIITIGEPVALLIILVILKIALDVAAHLVEHKAYSVKRAATPQAASAATTRLHQASRRSRATPPTGAAALPTADSGVAEERP